jgi:phospholipase C
VWSKTALFLTFDENDGFSDHKVPPYPASSAAAPRSLWLSMRERLSQN